MISEIVDYVELRCMYNIGSYRLLPLTIVERNNLEKSPIGGRFTGHDSIRELVMSKYKNRAPIG